MFREWLQDRSCRLLGGLADHSWRGAVLGGKDWYHKVGSARAQPAAWCKAGTLASALCTSGAWGSVGHRPVLPPRAPHDPPPQNQVGTGSPGLAVALAAQHPAVAGGGHYHGPAAQAEPNFEMPVLQELTL